jgi:hypothetical protein
LVGLGPIFVLSGFVPHLNQLHYLFRNNADVAGPDGNTIFFNFDDVFESATSPDLTDANFSPKTLSKSINKSYFSDRKILVLEHVPGKGQSGGNIQIIADKVIELSFVFLKGFRVLSFFRLRQFHYFSYSFPKLVSANSRLSSLKYNLVR